MAVTSLSEGLHLLPEIAARREKLLADVAEAALRLNTEPEVLARVLASRGGQIDELDPNTDKTSHVLQERLCLAARELAENRHALNALHSCWSWRLTAPLRALLEWVRILSSILRNGGRGFLRRDCLSGFIQWLIYKRTIRSSQLFHEHYYLLNNPDVACLGVNPLFHYCVFGHAENRRPNCLFDGGYYCKCNPDVARSMINPLVHYLKWGAFEGRNPHPHFHSSYYLAQCSELRKDGWNPLAHFLGPGVVEGYNPNPWFDAIAYLERNPAVAALGVNPLLHHVENDPHVLSSDSNL